MLKVFHKLEFWIFQVTAEPGSITQWLERLQNGDSEAAKEIWSRYYPRVLRLAATQLIKNNDPSIDEEDVAQAPFERCISLYWMENIRRSKIAEVYGGCYWYPR